MVIATITAGTSASNIQIEKSIKAILIVGDKALNNSGKITLKLEPSGLHVIPKLGALEAAEILNMNSILYNDTASCKAVYNFGDTLPIDSNEMAVLDITGLTSGNYTIYGIEADYNNSICTVLEHITVSGASKDITISNQVAVFLDSDCESVALHKSNGTTNMTFAEIQAISEAEGNLLETSTALTGYGFNFHGVSLTGVKSLTIYGQGNYFTVSRKAV